MAKEEKPQQVKQRMRVSVFLDGEEYRRLKVYSASKGETVDKVVAQVIRSFLQQVKWSDVLGGLTSLSEKADKKKGK